ncbi:hypothetical protein HZB03_05410 [Candidatus Woesearchaeota archaeon]|nr:hypothetical protein [Candidatus Woesearchaeota archaeon]
MCIISTVLITACAEQQQKTSPTPKFSVTKSPQAPMPPEDIEEKLNEEIDKGKILAIYENPLIATSIAEKKNYVMIKNAYEQPKGFGIGLDCTVCTIEEKTVNISAKSTATIPFMVKKGVKAGRYNAKIVIKDDRNNFYATEEIDIIVAPR